MSTQCYNTHTKITQHSSSNNPKSIKKYSSCLGGTNRGSKNLIVCSTLAQISFPHHQSA